MTQDEFLDQLWKQIINSGMDGKWVKRWIDDASDSPDGPFADVGAVLKRMIDSGVSAKDLAIVARGIRYETCFEFAEQLEEADFEPDEISGMHESLLMADPSGMEGRPGSWPIKKKSRKKGSDQPGLLIGKMKKAFSVAFSADGSRIATAGGEVWDIKPPHKSYKCKLLSNTTDVALSPDGKQLVAQNTSGHIASCLVDTGEVIWKQKMKGEGVAPHFSPDGRFILGADWDGNVFEWDARTGKVRQQVLIENSMIHELQRLSNGDWAVTLSVREGNSMLCQIYDAALKKRHEYVLTKDGSADNFVISYDRKMAVLSNYSTLQRLRFPAVKLDRKVQRKTLFGGADDTFSDLAMSPDGEYVAVVSSEAFYVVDAKTLKAVARVEHEYANHAAFSPDGSMLAIATWDVGEVWDFATFLKVHAV